MDILAFLIPLSLVLLALVVGAFFWAVNSGQFDDLDAAAQQILFDQEPKDPTPKKNRPNAERKGS